MGYCETTTSILITTTTNSICNYDNYNKYSNFNHDTCQVCCALFVIGTSIAHMLVTLTIHETSHRQKVYVRVCCMCSVCCSTAYADTLSEALSLRDSILIVSHSNTDFEKS